MAVHAFKKNSHGLTGERQPFSKSPKYGLGGKEAPDGVLGLNFGRFGRFGEKKWEYGRFGLMGDLGGKNGRTQ